MKLPSLFHPLLTCGALLASVSSVSAQNTLFLDRVIVREDVVLTSDVWYGEGEEEPDGAGTFYLDIYRPSNLPLPDELPTIIYLHGGNGDKGAVPAPSYCYEFARRGYVAIAVQYRVGNVITAAGDVANAIRWVRENAASYKVDTDRILVGGHSFGGVTSAELTANQSDYFGAGEGIAATLLCAAALNQFPVNTSEISLDDPPIMIVHGRDDPIAAVNGIRSLVTDLDRLTDPVNGIRYSYSYLEVAGAGHAFYPGTGSGITFPFIAGPIDADQGWSNTEIAGMAVADHVFEFFFDHLNLAGILAQSAMVLERNWGMSVADVSFRMSIKQDNRITYRVHSSPDLMIWTPAVSEPELNGEFLEVALPLVPPQMFHRWGLRFDCSEITSDDYETF